MRLRLFHGDGQDPIASEMPLADFQTVLINYRPWWLVLTFGPLVIHTGVIPRSRSIFVTKEVLSFLVNAHLQLP